jgi:acetyl esterase/lipase
LILSTPIMDWFFDCVDPDASARERADLSPLLGDVSGLPPALFLVGTADPLLDDTLFMHQRWLAAGSSAELEVYPGGVHGFDAFEELAIGRDSRTRAAAFAMACI